MKDGKMALVTANAVTTQTKKVENLTIQGLSETAAFHLRETLVMDEIVDVSSSIPSENLANCYRHLQDLEFPQIKEKKVELLLGSGLHQAYLLKDIRIGAPGEPTGMHTALGWTIYGKDDGNQEVKDIPRVMVNFVQQMRPSRDSCNDILKILEQDFADLDVPQVTCMSLEDKRALQIMNKTVKKIGDHYSVGLLWKDDDPQLPNNREMAVKRLLSMKRKFIADPNLHQKYSQKMDDYIKNGYAIAVSDNAPSGANYIPHHCTSVTTKFRVMFDCSAKFRGLSLNDCYRVRI